MTVDDQQAGSAEGCAECARQERLLSADPTEEWVAEAWAQATPHPHADPASAEGLAERIAEAMDAMALEGNRPNIVYAREIVERAALRSSESDSGIDDLYRALVSEHGHDERHEAVWPACLPVHMAMNRYRLSTQRTETSAALRSSESDSGIEPQGLGGWSPSRRDPDRASAEGLPTHCSVCGRRILTNRITGKCWKHR